MEVGKKVKVSPPNPGDDALVGEVIKEAIAFNGLVMSKVKFSNCNSAWYADQNLNTEDIEISEKVLH